MAQLYYYYGAMNSGKSLELLKIAHNYSEEGKRPVLLTASRDTRNGKGRITTRVGLSADARTIAPDTNAHELLHRLSTAEKADIALVDEAQFLTRENIRQIADFVDEDNVPVMCFGLKTDFQGHLFEGSDALLCWADTIREIKTICWFCGKKAIMNLRIEDGKPVYTGARIQLGGNESYLPVCRRHYLHPPVDGRKSVR